MIKEMKELQDFLEIVLEVSKNVINNIETENDNRNGFDLKNRIKLSNPNAQRARVLGYEITKGQTSFRVEIYGTIDELLAEQDLVLPYEIESSDIKIGEAFKLHE